jgi:hypothetical protein
LQLFGKRSCGKIGGRPKRRGSVAQLASIVEQETGVSVFFAGLRCGFRRDLSGHSEMHEQCGRSSITICSSRGHGIDRRKAQEHEFSVAFNSFYLPSRQMLLERGRVIDEIRFPEADDTPATTIVRRGLALLFDFRKFWHRDVKQNNTSPPRGRRESHDISSLPRSLPVTFLRLG